MKDISLAYIVTVVSSIVPASQEISMSGIHKKGVISSDEASLVRKVYFGDRSSKDKCQSTSQTLFMEIRDEGVSSTVNMVAS